MVKKWKVVIKYYYFGNKELNKILLLFKLKKIYMYDYDQIVLDLFTYRYYIHLFVYNSNSSSWHFQVPTKYQYIICKKRYYLMQALLLE